jgi:hypothetical protein
MNIIIEHTSDESAWILAVSRCQSGSIAVYRPQAEMFGGRSDGKSGVLREEVLYFPVLMSAGDN